VTRFAPTTSATSSSNDPAEAGQGPADWGTGALHVAPADTGLGASGYELDGEAVAPYRGGTPP
jgi:hypothetical protein